VNPVPLPSVLAPDELEQIVALLVAGSVVALPTDTVYGLAARLDRPSTERVFAAKGRPPGLALPVLVGEHEQVALVAAAFPATALAVAERFWPGPVTVVVRAKRPVGRLIGGDGRTVGIRWPDHPLVEQLCIEVGPLAVTSANRHGDPPCTSASAVVRTFGASEVAAVVDGGDCDSAPSTVVDCSSRRPGCLREGAVPWARIEAVLG
jgi:tRNA threonylcarbamoyl adenosine modification protein (Sua5/YciO/YrdC/YwlC family)